MRTPRLALLAALAFALGCGSSSGPAVLPNFTVAAAPSTVTLQSGGSARALTVTTGAVNGFAGSVNISLSGLPTGVTASPSTLSLAPGQLGQFMLSASDSAAPTSSTMVTVTASAEATSHTATAALSISPAQLPDFTVTAAPTSVSLQSGGSARSFTVTTAAVNGFTDPVTISLSGLPAGVVATPSTLTVNPGQLGQFTLAASTAAGATSGATITVTGSADSLSHTATAALSVMPPVVPDFSIAAAPSSISLPSGGSARTFTVTTAAINGFSDPVTVSLSGLPAGVTATPSSLSITPGQLGQFTLTASSSAATTSSASFTVTGTDDSLSHTATASLSIAPAMSNATISATSYDFGNNLVGNTLTKSVVTVTNTGSTAITLSPALSGDASYSVATGSCATSLAAGASCSESISYAPTTASGGSAQTATLNLGLGNVPAGTLQTVALTGTSAVLPQGTVSSTNNPQVALYTMTLPFPGSVTINFGTDTTYGKRTWTQSTTQAGGTVSIFVAGMLANTAYHMQAAVQFQNGVTATDVDHTFTSGTPLMTANVTVTTTPGLTPQPGVEQITALYGPSKGIAVTDLQGNTIWSYVQPNAPAADDIEGVKLLPNGHFLIGIGAGSTYNMTGTPTPATSIVAIREIDLAGNIVREISANELTAELKAKYAATGQAQYNINLLQFHHDVTPLPNGHMLVLSNVLRASSSIPGYVGTATNVLGDVIIDLDQNLQPVWVWNEFDHFDVNRRPMQFPDWTHTNAVVYSPDDHNILVSLRHQNWVVKVDYQDGTGTGNVLWKLGYQGDFTLVNGTAPQDWQYAQHNPSIVGPTSAGIFSLIMMDNGDDRVMSDGGLCGTGTEPACYSTIPVFKIDETAKTATLTFHQIQPAPLYSFWGGSANAVDNGDFEYDLCAIGAGSDIFEVTPDNLNPTTVWHMHSTGSNDYRASRIPSLYPGVQW